MANNFKADLEYGQLHEKFVSELGNDVSIEVKADRKAFSTGNIFIEVECNSKPSGIMSTEALYWVHLLPEKGEVVGGLILRKNSLKKVLKGLINDGLAIEKNWSGDGGRVKGVIISLNNIGEVLKRMNNDTKTS